MTSRRAVLASVVGGGAGLALGGCWGSPKPSGPPKPHPLAPTLAGVQAMVDRYQATIAAYPDLEQRLQPLLGDHRAHLDAVHRAMGTPSPSASPSTGTGAGTGASPSVPPDPAGAMAALKTAEQTGQADAAKACLAAPAEYAALIGSIAACRATHVEVLT